jgi:hypothetical protein
MPFTIFPTGKPPISFEGQLVEEAGGPLEGVTTPKYSERWNVARLFQLADGRWLVAIEFATQRKGESPRVDVYVGQARELAEQLAAHDPLPAGYGWPPIDRFTDQWAGILRRLFDRPEFTQEA